MNKKIKNYKRYLSYRTKNIFSGFPSVEEASLLFYF